MRKLLFESLLQSPLTERGTARRRRGAGRAGDDASTARRAAGSAAAFRSARWTPAPATAASWRSTPSTTPSTTSSGSACASSPRRATPTCCSSPARSRKNMREALERTYPATPDPKWVVAVGDCAHRWRHVRRQLCLRRRGLVRHSGRSPHPRLPAASDRSLAGPDRPCPEECCGMTKDGVNCAQLRLLSL